MQRELTDHRQAADAIERGSAIVALQINAGAAALRKGNSAPLQVLVDGTNSNTDLIASGYINKISLRFAREYQRDRIARISPQLIEHMPSVQLEQQPWYNPRSA